MHIAILTGGISTEREVALRSAENMEKWMKIAGHTCEIFDFPSEIHRFLERYQSAYTAKHFPTKSLRTYHENHPDFERVIPVFHGIYGEDGQVTAFLKTLGYRYSYSETEVHALCIDKYLTNLIIEKLGITLPRSLLIKEGEAHLTQLENPLICYPIIAKPNRGGSSIATSKVQNRNELINAQKLIQNDDILLQECIEGREFTVGIYRDIDGYHALPMIEIITKDSFFDYEEKYETDGSNEVFLEGEDELQKRLSSESLEICAFLGTKGVVRIDWRYDGKDIYFLEVNTIPGFTKASLIPKMWKKAGKTENEFVKMLTC